MDKRVVIYFCLFGFALRGIYIVFFNPDIVWPDEKRFWQEANSLISHFTFEAKGKFSHDMPLTGIYIAAISFLSDHSVLVVKLSFAIISAVTIYYIAVLSHIIYPHQHTATIAAAVASIYPYFIHYSSLLLSETLFLLFVVLLFSQIIKIGNESCQKVGVFAAISHLIRPTLFFFLPVIFIWQIFINKCSVKKITISIILFLVIVMPWGIRNLLVLDHFQLSTSGAGQALWEGNNPWNKTGGVSGGFSDPEAYLEALPADLNEFEEDAWKKAKAIQFIKSDPSNFVSLAVKKFLRFWSLWPNSPDYQSWKYKLISLLSFGLILGFALLAVFLLRKDFKRLSILYLFLAYYTAIHMVTIGSIRYRLPLEPILIALAGAAIANLFSLYKKSQYSSACS